jgi:hypothetical protein
MAGVQEPGFGCLDGLAHARDLVSAEVVQDERVTGPQGRNQCL